jgi:hypothetical protein
MRGAFDEPGRWTGLCENFVRLRDEARQYGMEQHWRSLVDATRNGAAPIDDWTEFTGELAARRDEEQDFSWREGERVTSVRLEPAATGYVCPAGLCRRTSAPFPGAAAPRCPLLDKEMTELVR